MPNDRPVKEGVNPAHPPEQARLRSVIEKKSMINLVQAFSVAVKVQLDIFGNGVTQVSNVQCL